MIMKRIILDVDLGVDDAWALLFFIYVAKLQKIKIEAITCCRGNTDVDNSCKNVIRLLEILGRTDIPVYKGAYDSIIKPDIPVIPTHFGNDGFGDLDYPEEPDMSLLKETVASTAIRDIVKNNPNEITLVCLGPLTNIALAVRLYDDFITNVKELYVMGGNYKAIGNSTSSAEFNFFMDPEAAKIVLDSAKCPLTLFVYEAGAFTDISIDWRFEVLGKIDNDLVKYMNEVEKKIYASKLIRNDIWYPFDYFLAALVVYPDEAIARQSSHHVTVELAGNLTRGQMILDHLKKRDANAIIIEKIHEDFMKKTILTAMQTF